jgi:ABC-2 type transport system permease protein
LRVAQREYLAYVRTKTFVISIVMLPVILALAFGLPAIMETMPKPPRAFAILDRTGRYSDELHERLRETASGSAGVIRIRMRDYVALPATQLQLPADSDAQLRDLRLQAQAGDLFAFFILSEDSSSLAQRLDYYTTDVMADELRQLVHRNLVEIVTRDNLRPFVADEEVLRTALRGISIHTHAITEEGAEAATATHIARSMAPMLFVYLLWISIMTMASHLLTSTVEEKSSRIIEIILSSVSPLEFMTGKLLGLAAAGLTTIAAWILSGALVSTLASGGPTQQVLSGLGGAFTPLTSFWFMLFFLLGFLFYASVYIGIGSVCNTMREAQSLLQPVMIIFIIPLFLMWFVTNNPDHIVAVIGSFIPPFTPFLIMNRIPANPPAPLWQVIAAAVLMVLSTWLVIHAAAKVFRIGILMYGKRPTLPEIIRWARQRG